MTIRAPFFLAPSIAFGGGSISNPVKFIDATYDVLRRGRIADRHRERPVRRLDDGGSVDGDQGIKPAMCRRRT